MSNRIRYELDGCPHCAQVKPPLDLSSEWKLVPASRSERAVNRQTGVPVLVDQAPDIDDMPWSRRDGPIPPPDLW